MSNNKYEECLIDLAPRLKKKGVEEYHDMAAKLCRMRVDEGTVREFAVPEGKAEELLPAFSLIFFIDVGPVHHQVGKAVIPADQSI